MPTDILAGHCPYCLVAKTLVAGPDLLAQTFLPSALRRFGDYELLEEVARGGMGIVYRARQLSLNRVVALKMILAGEFASPDFVRRFQNEAAAAARLRHPNIVTIHEVGEQDGQHYFAMEFVDGPNFADLVAEHPLSPKRAATYLEAIARAVAHAHGQSVLHRDLKPSNILLDPFDQPRVTDFGLARQLDVDSHLTLSGQALGSPGYMPPEQALGHQGVVGPASDIYSLGALLYHLLTGRPPFQADTLHAILLQVQTMDPVSLRRLNPSVPVDLETICQKCLEKEPAERYSSAGALAEDLGRFLRDEPVRARPIGPVHTGWRWCRRRPAIAALAASLLIALVAGLAGVLWQARRAELAHIIADTTSAQTRIHEYATDIRAAAEAVERGLFADARRLLLKHRPQPGQPDERGFEWYFVWHRSRGQQRATLTNHTSTVCGVAVSPDGRWIASAGMDSRLCLWNLETLQLHKSWPLGGVGWFVQFSPDSTLLFSSKDDDKTAVWQVPDGKLVREVDGARASVARDRAIVAGFSVNPFLDSKPAPVRISDYKTGAPLRSVAESVCAVALSPDGNLIALGLDRSNVVVRELSTDRLLTTITTPAEAFDLRFSPDSTTLAVAGWTKSVRVCDLKPFLVPKHTASESPLATTSSGATPPMLVTPTHADSALESGHWLKTWAVAFSPDGRRIASTGSDRSVRVWDAATLSPLELFNGHADEVWCVAWTPDGKRLITGGKDGLVMVWETDSARQEVTLPNDSSRRVTFSPDGSRILTHPRQKDRTSAALFSKNGERLDQWPATRTLAGFTADGSTLVEFDSAKASLNFWTPQTNRPVRAVALESLAPGTQFATRGSALSREGRFFVGIATNGLAQIWETTTGLRRAQLKVRIDRTMSIRLSRDGRWLALSADSPYEAYLYDTENGHERVLRGHTEFVKSVGFSQDNKLLATAGIDGRIRIWDTATGHEIHTLAGHWQSVDDVEFTPDGRTLASIETRTCLKLWRLDTFREVVSIPLADAGENLAFAPDGQRLAINRVTGLVTFLEAPR